MLLARYLELLGGDAPECVVFRELEKANWADLHTRLNRGFSVIVDACKQAITHADHHEWVRHAANKSPLRGAVFGRRCVPRGQEFV